MGVDHRRSATKATIMAAHAQDMPPKGGYAPITYHRIPAKNLFKGWHFFAAYGVVTTAAAFQFFETYKQVKQNEIEMHSATPALQPLLIAERDRAWLKQLSQNRDEEEKLMANVEGWEVGTYYGEPIYKTVDPKKWIDPILQEYFAHGHSKYWRRGAYFSFFT